MSKSRGLSHFGAPVRHFRWPEVGEGNRTDGAPTAHEQTVSPRSRLGAQGRSEGMGTPASPPSAATPPRPGTRCSASPTTALRGYCGAASCGAMTAQPPAPTTSRQPVSTSPVLQKILRFSQRLRLTAGPVPTRVSSPAPTGEGEGDQAGSPEKGGAPQAVRRAEAAPGLASCALLWVRKKAAASQVKGHPSPPRVMEGPPDSVILGKRLPSATLGKSPHLEGFCFLICKVRRVLSVGLQDTTWR